MKKFTLNDVNEIKEMAKASNWQVGQIKDKGVHIPYSVVPCNWNDKKYFRVCYSINEENYFIGISEAFSEDIREFVALSTYLQLVIASGDNIGKAEEIEEHILSLIPNNKLRMLYVKKSKQASEELLESNKNNPYRYNFNKAEREVIKYSIKYYAAQLLEIA